MADFKLDLGLTEKTPEQKATAGELDKPLAYIFLGKESDKNVRNTRSPQEWRKLFIALAEMAGVKQNVFGLTLVYDAMEALIKDVDKKAFKAKFDKISKQIDEEDAKNMSKRVAKMNTKRANAAK